MTSPYISRRTWMVSILLLVAGFVVLHLLFPSLTFQDEKQTASRPKLVSQSSENRPIASSGMGGVPDRLSSGSNQQAHTLSRPAQSPPNSVASNAQIFQSFFDDVRENQQNQPEELQGLVDAFIAEKRDEAWASQVETSVLSEVASLRAKYGPGLEIQRVECRETLCLVGVVTPASLQSTPLEWQRALSGMSYENNSSFDFSNNYTTMAAAENNRIVYLSYLIR